MQFEPVAIQSDDLGTRIRRAESRLLEALQILTDVLDEHDRIEDESAAEPPLLRPPDDPFAQYRTDRDA